MSVALDESPAAWRGSKLGPYKAAIDCILEEDAGSLKRRSVPAICKELGITDVSEATVGAYVSWRRREIRSPDSPGCRTLRGEGARDQGEADSAVADLPRYLAARIVVNPATGCWEADYATNGNGYTTVWWRGKRILTHRLAYMLLVGPIPDGLQIDHVKARGCRSRRCCNPAHLEPVTPLENTRRALKSECKYGHPFDEVNTHYLPNGRRVCLQCRQRKNRERGEERAIRAGRVFDPSPRDMTRCKNGHEYTPENTIERPAGRDCRTCARKRNREYRDRKSRKSPQNAVAALRTNNQVIHALRCRVSIAGPAPERCAKPSSDERADLPMLTSVWHVACAVLTVIGALSVCSCVCLLWAARQAGRREDARQREFDARLDAILRDWAGEAR